jgi:beta-lactamase class A
LDKNDVNNLIARVGMTSTDIYSDNQTTTPKDVGIYFQKLWSGEILNRENSDELLSFMTKTIYEDYLAAGVPSDIQIAHKYGREVHVVNDGGIVFTKNPYSVVILSKGVKDSEADKVFSELSKAIYELETKD